MADYNTYLARTNTQNLIKLIEAGTRHQAGLRLQVTQERNIKQLQELQAELFRRIA